ncbi:kinase-like domain-containing protein [Dichomitus squalens]|uniref:Kinase-like domain-containing protein n=1 Tax=Dichomitus squalens TaxID=114155 RepID=A0A4Q9MYL3_9APHY|nr:kinase-like domain-containing protein [Dichomitus squalens]
MASPRESFSEEEVPPFAGGALSLTEIWWRDHQVWLQERGYMLRPRYRPDWIPSWASGKGKFWDYEDGHRFPRGDILDATRISDGNMVGLKRIHQTAHPYEVEIANFLSSEPLLSDQRNHSVHIYEVLDVPDDDDMKILVMPMLRAFYDPRFLTVGEAVELFRQCFEGLCFLHDHHVAHRDVGELNIMMDPRPMFPRMFHFADSSQNREMTGSAKHYTRTWRPVKYFFIDFGLSRKHDPAAGPPRYPPIWGADRTVPEFRRSLKPCDPFPTDVYYMGNVIRQSFLQKFEGLEFMVPLVNDMVHDEPANRPTMEQVVARFDVLMGSLSTWRLRSRLAVKGEHWSIRSFRVVVHTFRTLCYILTFRPALPHP